MTTNLFTDTFTRTNNASSWGTASGGGTWAKSSGSSTSAIASNEGTLTGATGNTYMALGSSITKDAEGLVRLSSTSLSLTNFNMGLTLRYQSTTNYYFCGYVKGDAGLSIYKTIAGTGTKLATISESLSTSTFYWIRWRMATNTAGTAITFYAKMWQDGNSEQSTWDISAVESTNILSSGTVGIVANPVTTATVSFDSYTVNQVFDSIGTTRATFYTQFKALTDATQVKFITARALIGKTKDLFRTSSVIKGITRGTFNTKIVGMKGAGREKFYTAKRLLSGLLETFINNRVVYNQWFNLRATSVKSLISLKFGDVPVAQPYSSIQVKVTAMNASNAAISNLASLTCVVTFPDGSVSPVYSLGGAITNTGGGTYILIYNTLMQGINNELWVATDLSGDISQYLNKTPVIY